MSKLVSLYEGSEIKVSELKKDTILKVIEKAKEYSFINQIVLFGSCLEERCKETSDIDIIIVGNKVTSKCLGTKSYNSFISYLYSVTNFSQDFDIFYVNKTIDNIKGGLSRELKEKGVIIYGNEK